MGRTKQRKTHPTVLRARERAEKALKLRLACKDWKTIADELGYKSVSAPFKAVMKLLERRPAEDIAKFRKLELRRLEKLRASWIEGADAEDTDLDSFLKITDRIHKIMGIQSQQKIEHTGNITLASILDETAKIEREQPNRITQYQNN